VFYDKKEYYKKYKFSNNGFNGYGYHYKTKTKFNPDGYNLNNVSIEEYKYKLKKDYIDLRNKFSFNEFGFSKEFQGLKLKYNKFIMFYYEDNIDAFVIYGRNIIDDIFNKIRLITENKSSNSLSENIYYVYDNNKSFKYSKELEYDIKKLLNFIKYANNVIHDNKITFKVPKDEIKFIIEYFFEFFRNFNFIKENNKEINSFGVFKDTSSIYDEDNKNVYGESRSSLSFTENGYNQNGFDVNGFDKNGFNEYGFNIEGLFITGSLYDNEGFNIDGLNVNGFNIEGINYDTNLHIDSNGYDINGFDSNKIHKITNNKFNKYGFTYDGVHKLITSLTGDILVDAVSIKKMLKEFNKIDSKMYTDDEGYNENYITFRFAKKIRHSINNIIHESNDKSGIPFVPWENILTRYDISPLDGININAAILKNMSNLSIAEKIDSTTIKNILTDTLKEQLRINKFKKRDISQVENDFNIFENDEALSLIVDQYIDNTYPICIELANIFSFHMYNKHINLSLTSIDTVLAKIKEAGYNLPGIWYIKYMDRNYEYIDNESI